VTTGLTYTFAKGFSSTGVINSFVQKGDSLMVQWGNVSGNATIWLVTANSNGCKDSTSESITINATPAAAFTVNRTCAGSAAQFYNSRTGNAANLSVFGDADSATAKSPAHIYKNAGSYKALLLISN